MKLLQVKREKIQIPLHPCKEITLVNLVYKSHRSEIWETAKHGVVKRHLRWDSRYAINEIHHLERFQRRRGIVPVLNIFYHTSICISTKCIGFLGHKQLG